MKKPSPGQLLGGLVALAAVSFVALANPGGSGTTAIDAVYFGQTHLLKPDDALFGLVSDRDALLKVHVVDPATPAAPDVTATLSLDGNTLEVPLTGPATLPAAIPDGPGVVQHSYDDSFTATLPAAWVQPGLEITVEAGVSTVVLDNLEIGAPNPVVMTMFDVGYFSPPTGDYPTGWQEEIEAKWPVSDLQLRRIPDVTFRELVIPPRAGVAAARVDSPSDYLAQTGLNFDGEQAAALAWNGALKRASGRQNRLTLSYINIYNVNAGGQAGGFSGVGNGTSAGILHHELGHALSLPHWANSAAYPYKGAMYGINTPVGNEVHAGPTWAYDPASGTFIPPTTQPDNVGGQTIGTYKVDPMQGGGTGFQEPGFLLNHFSDYSANQMRNYLEGHMAIWNETLGAYARWDDTTADYTDTFTNDGVNFPIEGDVEVITVMASLSGAKPDVCMVYPPIGPYTSGLIKRFDPRVAADRLEAQAIFAPNNGCDVSLRIFQGGIEKILMLPASWEPWLDPLSGGSLETEAINLPASDGEVTRVDLLLTPDAEVDGLPANPQLLATWAPLTPDPAGFASLPTAFGSTAINMTAVEGALDPGITDPVEYLFTETSGNPGGSSSGWQTNPSYTDTGLLPDTSYTYTVSMRAGALIVDPSTPASATTSSTTAIASVSVDATQPFSLQSGGGLKAVTGLDAFDADGADKLVVVVSTEHSFNNGQGFVNEVRYNGVALTEAVQEDAGVERGTAAIFYLDQPGPIGSGTIEVSASNPNGGFGAAYALTGTKEGVGVTNRTAGPNADSLSLTTAGENSLLIAVLTNSGNANGAGQPTALAPLTQGSSGNWGGNRQWGSHASGYQSVPAPSTVTPSFSTNTGSGYSITLAAAEFLAGISPDYLAWDGSYASADLSDPSGDFDGDGRRNEFERLFGTNPTAASSFNPITVPLTPTGDFTYTRRDDALTGKTYTVWYSTTLEAGSWMEDTGALQIEGPVGPDGVETVAVTLTPTLLSNTRLFVRVEAE